MTPVFTIIFISKMLICKCITSLEHTFLVDGLNSLYGDIEWYVLKLCMRPISQTKWLKCLISFALYNALDLNNQKILWLPSIFQFERKLGF